MITKKELGKAMTAMVLVLKAKTSTDEEKSRAMALMDVLLWVGGYPSRFKKVIAGLEEMELLIDEIMEQIDELAKNWHGKPTDTQSTTE